jgi:fatty-acyl-CoA synthase
MAGKRIFDFLTKHAQANPDRTFGWLLQKGTPHHFSYRELMERSLQVTATLKSHGAKRGQVVVIILKHSVDLYSSFLGAELAGCIPSFMPFPSEKQDPSLYWQAHLDLFERIRPAAIIAYPDCAEGYRRHEVSRYTKLITPEEILQNTPGIPAVTEISPADIALLQHSSGTTGAKKGVCLTHEIILRQIEAYTQTLHFTQDSRIFSWLPLYHDMGLIACFLLPLVTGVPLISMDAFEWTARPSLMLDAISRYRATHAWLPNFAYNHLVRATPTNWQGDLSSLQALINCSEPCKAESFDRFHERFAGHRLRRQALQCCYAMAETVFAVTQTSPPEKPREIRVDPDAIAARGEVELLPDGNGGFRFLSVGQPLPILEVAILDESGIPLPERRIGEVGVRGNCLFSEYYLQPEPTAQAWHNGWYATGDLGFMERRELFITGRKKEILIINGRNYYAHDIEAAANSLSGIKPGRAVAFGIYSPEVGSEQVVIVAELDVAPPPLTEIQHTVKEAVMNRLGLSVLRVELRPPGWLVKTTSGKISRELNKQKYLACSSVPSKEPEYAK